VMMTSLARRRSSAMSLHPRNHEDTKYEVDSISFSGSLSQSESLTRSHAYASFTPATEKLAISIIKPPALATTTKEPLKAMWVEPVAQVGFDMRDHFLITSFDRAASSSALLVTNLLTCSLVIASDIPITLLGQN